MTRPNHNLCDRSLVDLQNALDRLRSDQNIVLSDHIVMESATTPGAPAWAIPAEAVTETLMCPELTRVGIMPGCFRGIAATRARLVTVIDAVHLLTGQPPAPDGRGWLTLLDPGLSGGHGIGLWWPSFCGISPVGAMPTLGAESAPVLPYPGFVHDWRIETSSEAGMSDRILARVDVHAMLDKIMTGPWWERENA